MDVPKALLKVEQFIETLENDRRLSKTFPDPIFRDPVEAAINDRIGFIVRIAEEIDPSLASRLREETVGWPYGETLAAAQELRGRLAGREEEADILAPSGPALVANQMHPWIWNAAAGLWDDGHYLAAVQQASSALFDAYLPAKLQVPKGSQAAEPGNAFSTSDPKVGQPRLRLSRFEREDGDDWNSAHDGAKYLGMACQKYIRNLSTHGVELEELVALEQLAALSLFARLVSEAEVDSVDS